jgi:hypothetical protein
MTEEMQKTKGCLRRDRTESEEYAGVQTVIGISHESLSLSAIKGVNQAFARLTPFFTPSNEELGVLCII